MKPLHLLKNISNMINHVLIIFLPIGHNNCSQNKTSLPEHEAKRQNKRKKKKRITFGSSPLHPFHMTKIIKWTHFIQLPNQ